jgi:hypothetical protein
MGKRRRASHRFSSSFSSFHLNLEDEILCKGGRICNTQNCIQGIYRGLPILCAIYLSQTRAYT